MTDPQGTTTYTYDGTDAAGNSEHRGLVTKIGTSRPGASDVEVSGAYDAAGDLVTQKLPGGITQRTEYDTAGEPTALSYSGTVSTYDPDSGAVTGTTPDSAWVGWSQDNDALGRVRREWTPSGAAFTGDTTGAATGYSRDDTCDRAARLVEVKDQTVPVLATADAILFLSTRRARIVECSRRLPVGYSKERTDPLALPVRVMVQTRRSCAQLHFGVDQVAPRCCQVRGAVPIEHPGSVGFRTRTRHPQETP